MTTEPKDTLPTDVERNAVLDLEDMKLESQLDRDQASEDTPVSAPEQAQPPQQSAFNPNADFKEGGTRGWLAVVGCWCVLFFTFGYLNAFGIYEAYYLETFLKALSPSDVAWIGSIQIFAQFSGGLISGPICDRWGPQVILYPSCLLLVVAFMLTSLCTRYYEFLLCQGVLGGLAMGLCYAPAIAVVGHYFRRKRPAAMGIAASGSALGGIIFPIMLDRLLNNTTLGFGWSQRIVAFLVLALVIVAVLTIRPGVPPRVGTYLLPRAFKQLEYTLLVAGLFVATWGLFTPFFYLPTFAMEHGMHPDLAWYLISILNAGSFFGRLIGGYLAVIAGSFELLSACCAVFGVLTLCLLAASSNAALIVLAVLFGIFSGGIIGLMLAAIAHTAPRPNEIGTYFGMASAILSIAALTGTPITGALISHYHSYSQAMIWSGVLVLAGAALIFAARLDMIRKEKVAAR